MHLVVTELASVGGTTWPRKRPLAIFLVIFPHALVFRTVAVGDLAHAITTIVLELSFVDGPTGPSESAISMAAIRPPHAVVAAVIRISVRLVLFGEAAPCYLVHHFN